jgi:hypothetical protein
MSKICLVSFSGDISYYVEEPYLFGYLTSHKEVTTNCHFTFLVKVGLDEQEDGIRTMGAKKMYAHIRKVVGIKDFIYKDKREKEFSCSCESKCQCETKTVIETTNHNIKSWINLKPFIVIKKAEDLNNESYIVESSWSVLK